MNLSEWHHFIPYGKFNFYLSFLLICVWQSNIPFFCKRWTCQSIYQTKFSTKGGGVSTLAAKSIRQLYPISPLVD